jgi:DNA processing protein
MSLHCPVHCITPWPRAVETAADILQELGPLATELQMEIKQQLEQTDQPEPKAAADKNTLLEDTDYTRLWDVLGFDPKPVDTLIAQSGLSAREVSSMLLMMELRGMIRKHDNGRYFRA